MQKEIQPADPHAPSREQRIREAAVGEPRPLSGKISIVDHDPRWQEMSQQEREKIQAALGTNALRIEHVGSTSVQGLAAKPIIDILLVVNDSANEDGYVPALERIGYVLLIREPNWHQHRMLKGSEPPTNLHVFSSGCPEVERMVLFRDWLRSNAADRDLSARIKLDLVQKEWEYVQNYADAKTAIVEEIIGRAQLHRN